MNDAVINDLLGTPEQRQDYYHALAFMGGVDCIVLVTYSIKETG